MGRKGMGRPKWLAVELLRLVPANANVRGGRHARITNKRQLRERRKIAKGMAKPKGWSWMEGFLLEWEPKTNDRSASTQVPLSGCSGYSVWGNEAKRWTMTLYNRPGSLAVDCFIINLEDSGALTDKEARGHSEHKLQPEVDGVEESPKIG